MRRIPAPLERYLGTVIDHYELTDHVTADLEGTYAEIKSISQIEATSLANTDIGADYSMDNPFIPAAITAQIAACNSDADPTDNVTDIAFLRRQNEV